MGEVLYFPTGNVRSKDERVVNLREIHFGANILSGKTEITPVMVLETLLALARVDQLAYLAVAATRIDGQHMHVELGRAFDEEDEGQDPPAEPA